MFYTEVDFLPFFFEWPTAKSCVAGTLKQLKQYMKWEEKNEGEKRPYRLAFICGGIDEDELKDKNELLKIFERGESVAIQIMEFCDDGQEAAGPIVNLYPNLESTGKTKPALDDLGGGMFGVNLASNMEIASGKTFDLISYLKNEYD